MSDILSVKEFTARIKGNLEKAFPFLWVRGEVTNLSRPGSGHVYFSLRDGEDQLKCVWFRGKQKDSEAFDPLTGEVFEDGPHPCLAKIMRDGDQIACAGALTVYGPQGVYQMLVDMAQETGQGDLLRRLEQLKRELAAKGWFAESRKRALPAHPVRVALVTAPTGAAVRDFVRIAAERGVGAEIRIYPVPVQGNEAAPKIVAAFEQINNEDWAEIIVLIRGGGSLEDLWAFNDVRLAEAIVQSRVPVLTGIGHEVDTSIADLASDRRAATPSHAAQILWQERHWYAQRVDAAAEALCSAMQRSLAGRAEQLTGLGRSLDWVSPQRKLSRAEATLEDLRQRLRTAMERRGSNAERDMNDLARALQRLEPTMSARRQHLCSLQRSLETGVAACLQRAATTLATLDARLSGLDPHGPLQRGYTLVWSGKKLVRGVDDIPPGTVLKLALRDGEAEARVNTIVRKGS